MEPNELKQVIASLKSLSPSQQRVVSSLIAKLRRPITSTLLVERAPFTAEFVACFGDVLVAHHAMSAQPFTKDKFEWAMVTALKDCGLEAEHGPRGLPGYDIVVGPEKWSLKTQADRSIKLDRIHISKFMELGKGHWSDEASLAGLRDRFLTHMRGYNRIFTLRHLLRQEAGVEEHYYELVEIPKALLSEAKSGTITMQSKSKQNPQPGYCRVTDAAGDLRFALYFDGGTERKLQVKNLRKDLCQVVAAWRFGV